MEVVKSGEEKKLKSAAESAAEFLKNRLYGAHIPRETSEFCMSHVMRQLVFGVSDLI